MENNKVYIPEYPANDGSEKPTTDYNKASEKEETKTSEKVISGQATRKKKGLGKKFAETFIADDAGSVGEYVIFDVLVPAMKDTLYDIVANTVSMFLFGGGARRPSGGYSRHTDYSSYSSTRRMPKSSSGASRGRQIRDEDRKSLSFDEIEFDNIADANKVLDKLMWRLDEYGQVTVADFYDYCGITPDYTETKYGWYGLEGAYVKRGYGGRYYVILPKPEYLA